MSRFVTRWILVFSRALAIGLFTLTAGLANATVDQTLLEKAEALIKSGKAEEAYQLLEPLEIEGAGDQVYDYLLGTAALESGRPSKATFVYERILAVTPGFIGVRADMGRAYLALGDYGRAKVEFEAVLSFQNLPLDLRQSVEQYAKAAEARSQEKRTTFNGYAELGVGRDSNIGSTTDAALLNLPAFGLYLPAPPSGLKTGDNYNTVGLGGEVNHQLNEQWNVFGGADYRGRNYQTYGDSSNGSLDLRGGFGYTTGAQVIRAGLTAGQFWQKGDLIRNSAGATVDWRTVLAGNSQLSAGLSVLRAMHVPQALTKEDTQTTALNLAWLTSLGDGTTVLSVTLSGGVEEAFGGRDDGDKRYWGPRLFVQKTFNDSLGGYVSLGATAATYALANPLYLFAREETQLDVTLGLTWTVAKGVTIRPQLAYVKNNSNAELYSYDKTDLSLTVRFDF
jgi:outer membrane protein